MTKYSDDYVSKDRTKLKYILSLTAIAVFVIYIVFFLPDTDYRLNMLAVREASIVEMNSSDGPWIRVSVPGMENKHDLWIEANQEFYDRHYVNDRVGILLGRYDELEVMKRNGKTYRRLQRQVWGVEEIYNNIGEAVADNPSQNYSSPGTIVSKSVKDGRNCLLVDLGGKKAEAVVDKKLFDQLQNGDKVQGEFESIGEFTRFIGVSKPGLQP